MRYLMDSRDAEGINIKSSKYFLSYTSFFVGDATLFYEPSV